VKSFRLERKDELYFLNSEFMITFFPVSYAFYGTKINISLCFAKILEVVEFPRNLLQDPLCKYKQQQQLQQPSSLHRINKIPPLESCYEPTLKSCVVSHSQAKNGPAPQTASSKFRELISLIEANR